MTAYPKSCGRSWSFIIIFGRLSLPECVYVFIARDVVRTVERQSVAGVSRVSVSVCVTWSFVLGGVVRVSEMLLIR